MPRAIWTGAISFGLVNVPVKLYSAVSSKTVRFHQLDSESGARVRQKRVSAATGDEVPYERIVKGYELAPDKYVVLEPDELEALDPEASRTIDIEDFVDLEDIDPLYFDHPYYLAPNTGAAKSYRLLLEAMRDTGKVGIARVVLRSKQTLCALRAADNGVMVMSTMNYADEVVPPESLDELDAIADVEVNDRELKMAEQLIESLGGDWDPGKYRDTYRERVLDLIERKAAGEEIAVQPEAEEREEVPDLMAALEASLAAVRSGGDPDKPSSSDAKPKATKASPSNGAKGKAEGEKAKPKTGAGSRSRKS
jgi:DNA end-binding protein Ku